MTFNSLIHCLELIRSAGKEKETVTKQNTKKKEQRKKKKEKVYKQFITLHIFI